MTRKNSDDCEALYFLASRARRSQRNARGCGDEGRAGLGRRTEDQSSLAFKNALAV